MKVDHVFGGHIYLISSFGDARNPLFKDDIDLDFFKANVEKYLHEICEIYAYSHRVNQFQYLVRIRERAVLEEFFHKKQMLKKGSKVDVSHKLYDLEAAIPPESYLIFSQEVSNCLNSYAKKFNFRHKRKGGLFGDRYSKVLIESDEEMLSWIAKLNQMEELVVFEQEWQVEEELEVENSEGECSSKVYYESADEVREHGFFRNFSIWISNNLRGSFDCLPPKSIKSPDFTRKFNIFKQIKGIPPPW